jgi:hypothetical protein
LVKSIKQLHSHFQVSSFTYSWAWAIVIFLDRQKQFYHSHGINLIGDIFPITGMERESLICQESKAPLNKENDPK